MSARSFIQLQSFLPFFLHSFRLATSSPVPLPFPLPAPIRHEPRESTPFWLEGDAPTTSPSLELAAAESSKKKSSSQNNIDRKAVSNGGDPVMSASHDALIQLYGLTNTYVFEFPNQTLLGDITPDPATEIPLPTPLLSSSASGSSSSARQSARAVPPTNELASSSSSSLANTPAWKWISQHWSPTSKSHPNGGVAGNLAFVADPFPDVGTNITIPDSNTLSVLYPDGSFSGNNEGGTLWWSTVLKKGGGTAVFTYDITFDDLFNFNKGGKLPGLYGNANANETGECSGGNRGAGTCFSNRLMWRQRGQGEVYGYIPTYDNFCDGKAFLCNDKFGMSISRGSWKFSSGKWDTISLLVSLNDAPSSNNITDKTLQMNAKGKPHLQNGTATANGLLALYHNTDLVMYHPNMVFRIDPTIGITAVQFETFFGGSGESWQSQSAAGSGGGQKTYWRNMKVAWSPFGSNITGQAEVEATLTPDPSNSGGGGQDGEGNSGGSGSHSGANRLFAERVASATLLSLLLALYLTIL